MAKIIPKNAPPRANKIVTGNFPMTAGNASNTALKLNSLLSGTCFKKSAYQLAVKRLVVAFTFNDEQIAGLSTLSYTIKNLIQRIKDFQKNNNQYNRYKSKCLIFCA